MEKTYVVASARPWVWEAFERVKPTLPGRWIRVTTRDELTSAVVQCSPRYVFFPHWSWKVPAEILHAAECVCFHMTDVPYGRGGSPLQNLISRGHQVTKLTALRMVEEMDAGDVYMKRDLVLDGPAHAVYRRAMTLAFTMIADIVVSEPFPTPQVGVPTLFKRRRPEESLLPAGAPLALLYEHIRMLDAEGYPKAFLRHGNLRLEFSSAELASDGSVQARVSLTIEDGGGAS